MPSADQDYTFFSRLYEILVEKVSVAEVLERAHEYSIQRRTCDITQTNETALKKLLGVVALIIPRYVQLFQDPRAIPVTHYLKQKALAIHLDQMISPILWERVQRRKVLGLINDDGSRIKDDLLDHPILTLKQEARGKAFPKNSRGGISRVEVLNEYFVSRLSAKGIHLDASETPERFEYGP